MFSMPVRSTSGAASMTTRGGDDLRVLGGEAERVRAAHAVADQRDGAQPEAVHERLEVLDLAGAGVVVVAGALAAAVAALVERDDAVLARELGGALLPDAGGLTVAVEQDQRVARTGFAPLVVLEVEAVDLDGLGRVAVGQASASRGQRGCVAVCHRSIAPRCALRRPATARRRGSWVAAGRPCRRRR